MALSGGVAKWESEAPAEMAPPRFGRSLTAPPWGVKSSGVIAFGAYAIFVLKPLVASEEGTKMVSAGFMPEGPQLAATQMATER